MEFPPKQTYIVTAEPFAGGVTVTVTQKGSSVTGVGSAPEIQEAFDLAHSDYVENLS